MFDGGKGSVASKKKRYGVKHILYKTRWKKFRCECGKKMLIGNPAANVMDKSGKAHTHCKDCKLEWHYTADGRLYSHPYQPSE